MIESVYSNKGIEYVVIDHDLLDKGENPVSEPREQNAVIDDFVDLFTDKTKPVDMEIREELKRYHF